MSVNVFQWRSGCRMALGALLIAVVLVGAFRPLHRSSHAAIRARGYACRQANLEQPAFPAESSDSREDITPLAPQLSSDLRQLASAVAEGVHAVSKARQIAFVPVVVRRLKLPSAGSALSESH